MNFLPYFFEQFFFPTESQCDGIVEILRQKLISDESKYSNGEM